MNPVYIPILLSAACSLPVSAANENPTADITFRGTLIERIPCTVNNGETITINFGDEMMTTRLDDDHSNVYSREVVVPLDCSSRDIRLRIDGITAAFNPELLAGNQAGFGFRFLYGDRTMPLNDWIQTNVSAAGSPDLTFKVRPVREEGVTINGGEFSIVASLIANYL